MANIKSAKKRAKQTLVRNARNTSQRSMLRTAVKRVLKAIEANDHAGTPNELTLTRTLPRRKQPVPAPQVEPVPAGGYTGTEHVHEGVLVITDPRGDSLLHGTGELLDGVPQRSHGPE